MRNSPQTMPQQKPNIWSRESRWLHAGIAFGVTWQLWSSLWMKPDWEQANYGSVSGILFSLHSWIGLMTALFILWQWLLISNDAQLRQHLFPWRGHWGPVIDEVRQLLRGHLPPAGPRGGLAGLVHGLGLLAITWMGLTGSMVFFFLPQAGTPPGPVLDTLVPLHKILGNVIWVYWIGHVGMAALHALKREPIWQIFRLTD